MSEVEKHPDMTDPQPKWTSGALEVETEYRARTKYYAASGEESPWSEDVTFKTDRKETTVKSTPGDVFLFNNPTTELIPVTTSPATKLINLCTSSDIHAVGSDGQHYSADTDFNSTVTMTVAGIQPFPLNLQDISFGYNNDTEWYALSNDGDVATSTGVNSTVKAKN